MGLKLSIFSYILFSPIIRHDSTCTALYNSGLVSAMLLVSTITIVFDLTLGVLGIVATIVFYGSMNADYENLNLEGMEDAPETVPTPTTVPTNAGRSSHAHNGPQEPANVNAKAQAQAQAHAHAQAAPAETGSEPRTPSAITPANLNENIPTTKSNTNAMMNSAGSETKPSKILDNAKNGSSWVTAGNVSDTGKPPAYVRQTRPCGDYTGDYAMRATERYVPLDFARSPDLNPGGFISPESIRAVQDNTVPGSLQNTAYSPLGTNVYTAQGVLPGEETVPHNFRG